eukprot:g57764.t1
MILVPRQKKATLLVINTLQESSRISQALVAAATRVRNNLQRILTLGKGGGVEIQLKVIHCCEQREGWECAYQSSAIAAYLLLEPRRVHLNLALHPQAILNTIAARLTEEIGDANIGPAFRARILASLVKQGQEKR